MQSINNLIATASHTPEDFSYFIKNHFRDKIYPYDKTKLYHRGDLILRWYGITKWRCEIFMARENNTTGIFDPNKWVGVSKDQFTRILKHSILGEPDDPSLHHDVILGHIGPSAH